MRRLLCGLACSVVVLGLLAARESAAIAEAQQPASYTVWLVRHAEKAKDRTNNPPLKQPEGGARAKALADLLAGKDITAIVTSKAKRTIETADPVAKGFPKAVVTKTDSVEIAVSKVKNSKGNVLVAHHSDTVPRIIKGLGGPKLETIKEDVYYRMFRVEMKGKKAVACHESTYGAGPSAPEKAC